MTEEEIKALQEQNKAMQDQLSGLQEEKQKMADKMEQMLTETKNAKNAKREAEQKAIEEQNRIAKEKGDFEQLYKSSSEKLSQTMEQFNELQNKIATEKTKTESLKIANNLAEGANVDLLSEFISRRIKYTEEGVKVTDANGNLTVSTVKDLENEFKNDARYSALLKGNQSSGGGAAGGTSGGGAARVISRAEFDALDAIKRADFIKSGGELTN